MDKFMPHGHCYLWKPEILWPTVIADATIGLSYIVIAIVLFNFTRKLELNIVLEKALVIMLLFIALCGIGHFIDIYNTWFSRYDIKAVWGLGTAAISAMAASYSIVVVKYASSVFKLNR